MAFLAHWPLLVDGLKTFEDPVTTEPDLFEATSQQGTPDKSKGKAGPPDIEKFFQYASAITAARESVMRMKARQQAWTVVRVAAGDRFDLVAIT